MKTIFSGLVLSLLLYVSSRAQSPEGLQVNQIAPDFTAVDQDGRSVNLKSLLQNGKVVLVFYRGEWCPYCNKYLMELEQSLSAFNGKGATVVAVTPERPEFIGKSVEKTKASFSILHDDGLKIMKAYDVAYKLDENAIKKYKRINVDLNVVNGEVNRENLPVPAVYVINKQGLITYRFFDPNYVNRAPIATIMKYL